MAFGVNPGGSDMVDKTDLEIITPEVQKWEQARYTMFTQLNKYLVGEWRWNIWYCPMVRVREN